MRRATVCGMELLPQAERAAVEAFGRATAHYERVARLRVTSEHELIAKEAQVRAALSHLYYRRDELLKARSGVAVGD